MTALFRCRSHNSVHYSASFNDH